MKKDEIVAKKIGRNLIVVIDGVKKTRVINTEEDKKAEESIKNKILLYNKKNNKLIKEEILYLVDTTKVESDKTEAKKKGLKKSIKKETKNKEIKEVVKSNSDLINEIENSDLNEADVAKLEKVLEKARNAKKKTETKAITTTAPRKGEY